ncbi:putative quinol monooxygenase [Inmirania thermothiophila]|uniref:Quinol monooxygenase YgiN n=1 Tax=Inmirania thermothiophila TaxID=1750597 RepID=A0A3N1YAC5_9GAMM|nr:antibiotic biosynthesis monooxygenase [Inmirania thermothiophila]ROR34582.1 quinol monooxygenase YgiN [Inmirania thermothiophila]
MIHRLLRYRVRADAVCSVEDAVTRLLEAVRREEPGTFYRVYRLGDGREYLHIMGFPDEAADRRHQQADYTHAFADTLYDCWESPAETVELELLGENG